MGKKRTNNLKLVPYERVNSSEVGRPISSATIIKMPENIPQPHNVSSRKEEEEKKPYFNVIPVCTTYCKNIMMYNFNVYKWLKEC